MALLSNDNAQKLTHAFCHYRQGTPQGSCGACHHYTGNSCEIVQDPIVPGGVCDFFVARQGAAPGAVASLLGAPKA